MEPHAVIPSERLKGIEAFVCTADAGSFTAAGRRLNLTNSAVSKSVARLEARLGSRLFDRTTRRLTLTDVGAAFYETCVRVLGDLADAEAVLAAHRSDIVGRLKVDVPIAFGRMRAMPLLLDFSPSGIRTCGRASPSPTARSTSSKRGSTSRSASALRTLRRTASGIAISAMSA
jgi:DNA-binding transcriptional LysR family regulator